MATTSRQTLLFARVLPPWLQEEIPGLLRSQSVVVDVLHGQPTMSMEVRHLACEISGGVTKRARVVAWLLEERLKIRTSGEEGFFKAKALVFAPTHAEVTLLSTHALLRHCTVALHGHMAEQERKESIETFCTSPCQALVTTD